MTTTDEECPKHIENYFIAPLCGLFLGLIAETFICSWSWLETGPMIRFSNGVRLPFIGPLLGAILAYLISTNFGQIKLQGWFKYWAVGAIFGLLTGFFIGAGILAPILARSDPDNFFLETKLSPAIQDSSSSSLHLLAEFWEPQSGYCYIVKSAEKGKHMTKSKHPIRHFVLRFLQKLVLLTGILLATYIISVGPAYAVLFHRMNDISVETSDRVMSFYSPLYYPCKPDRLSPMLNRYITFCIRMGDRF